MSKKQLTLQQQIKHYEVMTIGIIVAMEAEKNLVMNILDQKTQKQCGNESFIEGNIGRYHLIVLQSGIGKVCAAIGTLMMIQNYHPDYIINTGVAGSLDKKVHVMDVVISEKTVYHDVDCSSGNEYGQIQGLPLYFLANEKLLRAAKQINLAQHLHIGLTCSGDQFISNRDSLKRIKTLFPEGLAVDMESNAIAQVCYLYGVPFLSLRIISDTPGINDHVDQYIDFWKEAPQTSLSIIKQLLINL